MYARYKFPRIQRQREKLLREGESYVFHVMLHAEKRNSRSGFLSSFADYRAKSSDYRVSRSRTSLQREIKARASPPAAPSPRDISRGLNIGNEALDSSEANLLELTNKDGRRSPNTLDANSRRPWRIFQCSLFIACA